MQTFSFNLVFTSKSYIQRVPHRTRLFSECLLITWSLCRLVFSGRGFRCLWLALGAGLSVTDRSSSGQPVREDEEEEMGRGAGRGGAGGERREEEFILTGNNRERH